MFSPIMNVMSFPAGKKQLFTEAPQPQHKPKKRPTKVNRPNVVRKRSPVARPAKPSVSNIDLEEATNNPRDNIEVIVRVRPKSKSEKFVQATRSIIKIEGNTILFDPKEDEKDFFFHGQKVNPRDCAKRPNKHLRFTFDRVYGPRDPNVQIFEETFKPVVNHIIGGLNCSVFAYGATGSGKTFTMLGSHGNPGLTYLVAMELYKRVGEMGKDYECEISVSYLEIYNETLRDLLRPSGILNIREDGLHGVNIPNLTTHLPKDHTEMLELLSSGNGARTQHPTDHNAESSRSHAVFQVSVSMRRRFNQEVRKYKMAKAKLVMVDLAGSERGTLGSSGEAARHREGANINKSLLALGNCINALADGKNHVPYRDSKLTRLLKDSLGGNCKTIMIANIGPTNQTYDDSYNTLKYADRAKQIRIHYKKNIITDDDGLPYCKIIADLELENAGLKAALLKAKQDNLPGELNYESAVGMGDGARKISETTTMTSSTTIGSPLVSHTQFISEPANLENFIQLLSKKKKLDEGLVKASIKAKESEWQLKWKNWRIESLTTLSNGESDPMNIATILEKLRSLKSQFDGLLVHHEECLEKVEIAKRVFSFNLNDIETASKHILSALKMDDPFMTVSLGQFLHYMDMEREVGSRKFIENYYQQMSSIIFDDLLRSEMILVNSLSLLKPTNNSNNRRKNPKAKDYNSLFAMFLSEEPLDVGDEDDDDIIPAEFPKLSSVRDLIQLIKAPVVEYEPPSSVSVADDSPSNESGFGIESILSRTRLAGATGAGSSSSSENTSTNEVADDQGWLTNSSSFTDVNSTLHSEPVVAKRAPKLTDVRSGGSDSQSSSSSPFTSLNPSETSLQNFHSKSSQTTKPYSPPLPKVTLAVATNPNKKEPALRPSQSTIIPGSSFSKGCSNNNPKAEATIPLKNVPASTSISLKETPHPNKDKSTKQGEDATKDIIVIKAPPPILLKNNRGSTKKAGNDGGGSSKVLTGVKARLSKCVVETLSGKQGQNPQS